MVKIKICGITNLEDALAAVQSGADAIGFVFYKKSPRHISVANAKEISRSLPGRIKKIGVFVNAPADMVKKTARDCCLDLVQLHAAESPDYCAKLSGVRVIKAFHVGKDFDPRILKPYKSCAAFLFDTFSPKAYGGTGRRFKWALLKNILRNKKIFLSGGLNSRNVKAAIRRIKPDWVDVSSSVESCPGKKDHRLVRKFIEQVRARGRFSTMRKIRSRETSPDML